MTPERWREISRIFHNVRERPASERAEFLAGACAGNEELRAEVESLLAQDLPLAKALNAPLWEHPTATSVPAGLQLGPYRVESRIGAGGMGEVYRGIDTRLDRPVAIKILRDEFGARFAQEARAISALNHPHVCVLFDVGPNYLVMELVEGQTLAERLKNGPLPASEAITYGAQVAEALAAAHAKGIVHRDLKPANLMLTQFGIKVLDFGLARRDADETRTATGLIAGTPAYLAPELWEGKPADARSDLWALGLVLHEMAYGQRPPASGAAPAVKGVPPGLHAVIQRLLERNPDSRFQTAEEVARRLRELQRPATHVRKSWAAAGVLALLAAMAFWIAGARRNPAGGPRFARLTDFPDAVHSPALSIDGKMLTFVRGPVGFLSGVGQVYVKGLPNGAPVALTHDGEVKLGPSFSPDGSRVVYTALNRDWSSWSVPVSGGEPAPLMANASGLRWIAPGQLLFSQMEAGFQMGVVTATESRAAARTVYLPESTNGMAHFSAISPDRKSVLVVEMLDAVWQPCRLVPFDGSSRGRAVGPQGALCTAAAWSPDGNWMYFAAEVNGESHLWRQRYPDGEPRQLTAGVDQEWGVAVDPDGRSAITSVGSSQSTVWYHDDGGDRPISVEGYAYRPFVASTNLVVYLVRKAVHGAIWSGEIWSADLLSARTERLLPEFLVQYFHVSPDSQTIVFDSFDRTGRSKIWTAPISRSQPPRQLSPEGETNDQHPLIGASGAIYFMSVNGDRRILSRMEGDGSGRREIRAIPNGYLVNLSPDERWAAVWTSGGVTLYSLDSDAPRQLCGCAAGPIFQDSPRVSWTGDGKYLVLNRGGSMSGMGIEAVPWQAGTDLHTTAGALKIHETSVAPGHTIGSYAFARMTEHSNLYRLSLK